MAPLIAAALPLLPKIPSLARAVAGIFGKKVPDTVEATAKFAGEVMDMMDNGRISPEQKIMLETAIMDHKEDIMRIQNDRLEIVRQAKKDNLDTTVQLMGQGAASQDVYVSRTRPLILRRLFYACVLYSGLVTCLVAWLSNRAAMSPEMLAMAKWIGAWMFGTFSTAFVGYTTARTIDKKNPELKNQTNMIGKMLKSAIG